MVEIIALLYQEIGYRGVCYKSVPLYNNTYSVLHILASGLWSAVSFSTSKDTRGGLDLIRPEA